MLSRAGLEVDVRPLPKGGARLVVPQHHRERAQELSSRLQARYARRVEDDRKRSLSSREQKGLRALGSGTLVLVLVLLLLLWRFAG